MKGLLIFVLLVFLLEEVISKGLTLKLERVGGKANSGGDALTHPKKKCGLFSIFSKALGLCVKKTPSSVHKLSINKLENNTFMHYHEAALFSNKNLAYETMISLGNPLQTLKVTVDTGGYALWVPGKSCKVYQGTKKVDSPDCIDPSKVYVEEWSKSSETLLEEELKTSYQKGSVEGIIVEDHFAFGDSSNPTKFANKIKFGVAEKIHDTSVVGNLGLNLGSLQQPGHVFRQYRTQYLNQHPGSTFNPTFSIWLMNANDGQDGGAMIVGEDDLRDCEQMGHSDWLSVHNPTNGEWYLEVDKIIFGPHNQENPQKMPVTSALFDTGASWIKVTPTWYERIKSVLGAREEEGVLKTKCDYGNDPQLTIKFKGNSRPFKIPHYAFLIQTEPGKCIALFKKTDHDNRPWTLGAPWFRAYCTAFNWETNKIGLADMK